MMEDKIVNDVLLYLDGWKLENKPHHTRHKPRNPKYIDPFNETSEDIEDSNYRKAVTSEEILEMYDVAKIHVLNYIKRPVFPRTPVTHIALCMWTAGLLSQKARFRKQKIENSYNLIKEAKKLLQPHIKNNIQISVIGGRDEDDDIEYDDCDIEHYRHKHHHHHHHGCKPPKKEGCNCNKDHMYRGRKKKCKHHHHPPKFEYNEPDFDDFFLKNNVTLKILPIKGEIGDTVTCKAVVRDIYGNRVDDGIVNFYLEDDE